ncbi:Phosphoribosylaminoimidazole-succinocarboxamide synthase [Abeliophyllum distichum]|uniref:phosphoribosylaminoimidazolesuccinocarboxamide synthase n=1 Tax=Abeliophyllum distichum TaxID=126358 RepID=A0ABD1UH53_9LAMI
MSSQHQTPLSLSLQALTDGDRKSEVMNAIKNSVSNCLSETLLDLTVPGLKSKTRGKVRDIYDGGDYLVLVTTDRQSAFDRILASIPFKGQVLNETSLWWFSKTQHITPNAVVSSPYKNVTIAKKCSVFPVEFVVRGYVTGSTDTSLWTVYKNGVRNYCGNALPDGLVKNQKLLENILTPTTKAADHDVPVTPHEIVQRGLMTQDDYDEATSSSGTWPDLVGTKYEFGKGSDGTVLLIDEVHTPDSSRYWIADSYEGRFENGLEPENIDKVLPDAPEPEELVSELALAVRFLSHAECIFLYETITKSKFEMSMTKEHIHDRISRKVSCALSSM